MRAGSAAGALGIGAPPAPDTRSHIPAPSRRPSPFAALVLAAVLLPAPGPAQTTRSFRNGAEPGAGYAGVTDVRLRFDPGAVWQPNQNHNGGDLQLCGDPYVQKILIRWDLSSLAGLTVSAASLVFG